MTTILRKMVSKQKRRFEGGGFDLDLSYIESRIIAMGYPSESIEGLYRNKMSDVQRFLDSLHDNHYKVYNLCAERKYDHAKFHNRVAEFPYSDHTSPPLALTLAFCLDAEKFLDSDPSNVIVVHCKAGKGRTGTFISCLLLWLHMCGTASEAMRLFGNKRTLNGRGITIPSQERTVRYFEKFTTGHRLGTPPPPLPAERTVVLMHILMKTIPNMDRAGGCEPWLSISQCGKTVYSSKPLRVKKGTSSVEIECDHTMLLNDINIHFFHKNSSCKMFSLSFHTSFLKENLTFLKHDLDRACKDKLHKTFPPNFSVTLNFCEFSQRPVETITCFLCKKPVSPRDMTANCEDRIWHWDCALCIKCGKHVGDCCTFTPDKTPICILCAVSNEDTAGTFKGFFTFCEGCGEVIDSELYEQISDVKWHQWCFKCSVCSKGLVGEEEYTVLRKKLFCKDCAKPVLDHPNDPVVPPEPVPEPTPVHEEPKPIPPPDPILPPPPPLDIPPPTAAPPPPTPAPPPPTPAPPSPAPPPPTPAPPPPTPAPPPPTPAPPPIHTPSPQPTLPTVSCASTTTSSWSTPDHGAAAKKEWRKSGVPVSGGGNTRQSRLSINESRMRANLPTCSECTKFILPDQDHLMALGGHYHSMCFCCVKCKHPFEDTKFFLWKGKPHCQTCETELRLSELPKCGFCKQPIVQGPYITDAAGGKYHKQCFLCVFCGNSITGPYFNRDGKIYCPGDFERLFAIPCRACSQPITQGAHVQALSYTYHMHCFCCSYCQELLEGKPFFNTGGEPSCEKCAVQAAQAAAASAASPAADPSDPSLSSTPPTDSSSS
ncbi:pten protein [Pelomyxa schiedti]|nr:pten protein [Pelomyxa schiedti]